MNISQRLLLKRVARHVASRVSRKNVVSTDFTPMVHCRHSYNDSSVVEPVKMAYNVHESALIPYKNPVVIMHGLFGTKTNWQTLGKVINQKTERKVIVVDARNHGESPHTAQMSYRHLAQDIMQLLKDLQLKKVVLLGHSMGGSAVMYTALSNPNVVEKLIVVDMSPIRTSPSLSQMTTIFQAMQSVKFDPSLTMAQMRKSANEQLEGAIHSTMLRQFLLTNLVQTDEGDYKWRVNLPVLEHNFLRNIATFPRVQSKTYTNPTLFIGGAKSDYIPKHDHEAIKKLFPAATFKYIEDARHWLHVEKPQEFLAMANEFINK